MIISQYIFDYTGSIQEFIIPYTSFYKFEVWGAQGGSRNNNGAKGGYSKGFIYLTKGQKIYIYVGACPNYNNIWNGGGYSVYSGGDASDIRIGGTSLSNRVIVAGGGGGTGYGPNATWNYIGGAGGGLVGGDGVGPSYYLGHGGTQTSGGTRGNQVDSGWYNQDGSFGQGGNSVGNSYGGGGGGGWYGGGCGECGGNDDGGGGGGSSYISGLWDGSTTAGVQTGNGKIIISLCSTNIVALEKDTKLYIPDKEHFDITTKTFKEATIDEIIARTKEFIYTSNIPNLNAPFMVNGESFYPADIINFTLYKLVVIEFKNFNSITLDYNPSSCALSKTIIKIKDKYTPFNDNIFNPYLNIIAADKRNISYSLDYYYKNYINNTCDVLYEEILKDDFYLSFKLDSKTSILNSISLYSEENINYKQSIDYFNIENDYINTYITFNSNYKQVLINRITKQYFEYLNDTLDKF
ncbi:hypothetical protein B0P06_006119 [Clostridium saccharoperbutylacetonicum]|uniref:receptor protein-tyrosine kinase n=1 Tax=Clostridium saccharoperbutylacetonicum N1-4(HMT) TaxID=931276 RepID=M1N8E2_9CLOT|nr:glycine rich domain-containing protein [Clostridium saccharoperbutylacetonicum]AGF59607.1 glycine rich protein [Clostridium saccharoperbutylacetonicum N1-4(HMT)]NRT64536.1 hypothetical protein [Clostridium saccharoperbutylacetonicum]NSB29011.1 hypothetical protein [Clostridium saccharoperbutylacetonicum]NSB46226.1 hypothetical protein [Clostridium saccharoperbutylacetonicum]